MTIIIDGRKIKDDILKNVADKVQSLPFVPIFCDILVGDNLVSASYVRMKSKIATEIGIKFKTAEFPVSITTEELVNEIENLNKVPHMCGIIVQLPLPEHINKNGVLDAIAPELDVDCLGKTASENFYNNKSALPYPTALACMRVLESVDIYLSDKNIVMLGTGMLVGKPVAHLLTMKGLHVTTINRETANAKDLIKNADVIISAIGKGKFITGDMIKEGAIIIDAGTSEENGGVVGDVDMDSVKDVASYISPTPGGVGPVTVAMLMNNVLKVAEIKSEFLNNTRNE